MVTGELAFDAGPPVLELLDPPDPQAARSAAVVTAAATQTPVR